MTEDLDTTQDSEYSWTITNDSKESKTINLNAEILKILENSTRNPNFWNVLSCWSVVFLVRDLIWTLGVAKIRNLGVWSDLGVPSGPNSKFWGWSDLEVRFCTKFGKLVGCQELDVVQIWKSKFESDLVA